MEPRVRVSALLVWHDRILLCRQEKPGKEYWLLPGGGVDGGETLTEALSRELREEVGIADELLFEGPIAVADSIAPNWKPDDRHIVHIVFAADLSTASEDDAVALAGGDRVVDVRRIVAGLSAADAAMLGYARGILHWNRNQRHCGTCGAHTESRHAGHARVCTAASCGRLTFPRIEPAVIVLVESAGPPPRCLMVREQASVAHTAPATQPA